MRVDDYLELAIDRYSSQPLSGVIKLIEGSIVTTSRGTVDLSKMGKPQEKGGVVFVPIE